LGYDEDIIAGPGGRGYAEVVAEFAGTSGGQFVEPERVEGSDEIGCGAPGFDTANRIAAVGGNEFAGFGEDDKWGGMGWDGAQAEGGEECNLR
jgi:hypothetical protein